MATLSWPVVAVLAFIVYLVSLAVYRLVFSPIAKFPGPRLAALSNWYEFYWDVIKQGQFTFHIQQLHKKYGPIIRITPTELHIDDPEYYDTLYARGTGRRDKYAYFSGRFGYASDTFSTIGHDLHRMRRRSIAPFFSAAKIGDFEPVIREKCGKLCERLAEYQKTGSVVRFGRAWMALTTDIITQYSFGRSYDQLQSPDFEDTLHEALVAIYVTGQFALHFPIVFPILDLLPEWFVKANQPEILPVVGLRKDLAKQVRQIRDAGPDHVKNAKHPTIFHELLNSGLPPEETTDARLGDEAQLIVAAGLITTSWALSVAGYHLTAQPETAAKLRAELAKEAAVMPGGIWDWHRLEKLPYLYAVVHESIRLSHGIVTRDPRLAPDTELRYKEWVIPKNTPVSMTTVDILINESIYPEPKKFKPERWIGNEDKLEKFFVPFGKGTRQCIGINLAMAELYIAIATIFSSFEFELFETDDSDVEMAHAYLVPYTKWESKGIRVKVTKVLPGYETAIAAIKG